MKGTYNLHIKIQILCNKTEIIGLIVLILILSICTKKFNMINFANAFSKTPYFYAVIYFIHYGIHIVTLFCSTILVK